MEKKTKIDSYTLLQSLGKGGMGEVFLAEDPICQRQVALKCIREDLKEKKNIKQRFLKEATIAAQLAHPSIIPIYAINHQGEIPFYTMPYIEGETLRQILKKTRECLKKGQKGHPVGSSVPSLIRIFLHVCEAIAYAHSKKILHRDLKPENIIIGKYGEVLILDWGIADHVLSQNVKAGKAAGTVSYMAPERAFGKPSSYATEVYALGVILYQILTLELPFERGNFAAFKKTVHKERLIDPLHLAPYREIPHEAVSIVKKCLAVDEKDRYPSVDTLITDVKRLIEGRPEWVLLGVLNTNNREDWEFQENISLAKHTAITRHVDFLEWVNLMVSKQIFPDNIRIETEVKIKEKGNGIGILFSIPEGPKRRTLEEGYCLWVGSDDAPACQLFRSNLLVAENKEYSFEKGKFHHLIIEKFKEHVHVTINHHATLSYHSKFPLSGSHVGVLSKDADFELRHLKIYGSSQTANISCLAVPDAFFTRGEYDTALTEYRRIAKSFPGREEGREALFRAGITLIEKSKKSKDKHNLLEQALNEFEQLNHTSGAPLEYLGKSIVYDLLNDPEEEVKCLEFALRKYPKHPLLPILEEHIIYRMHASSKTMRKTAYQMILLALCYFPKIFKNNDAKRLLDSLQRHWEVPYFFDAESRIHKMTAPAMIAVLLAFWVKKLSLLLEMPKNLKKNQKAEPVIIENVAFALLELDFISELQSFSEEFKEFMPHFSLFTMAINKEYDLFISYLQQKKDLSDKEWSFMIYFLTQALVNNALGSSEKMIQSLETLSPTGSIKEKIDELCAWYYLLENNPSKLQELFAHYDLKDLSLENHSLFCVYGCYLQTGHSEKTALTHFHAIQQTLFPHTNALCAYSIVQNIDEQMEWSRQAFYWEKKQLYQKLVLYYRVIQEEQKERHYQHFLSIAPS
jgi:eukaryotic-like serine/threonine-protein kinase